MGDRYHGHMTRADGTHVPLSEQEAADLWAACEAQDVQRREAMPDTKSALSTMFAARTRLKDEGWSEGCYCPKDGTPFAIITYGSTGIFTGAYIGDWPDGYVISCDSTHHPDGLLWKALDLLSEDERARMEKCMADDLAMHERMIASLLAGPEP